MSLSSFPPAIMGYISSLRLVPHTQRLFQKIVRNKPYSSVWHHLDGVGKHAPVKPTKTFIAQNRTERVAEPVINRPLSCMRRRTVSSG